MKKQAFNPYLPTYEYIPDGEPRVFGDRVYVYGSHDRAGGDNYCQNDYVCWSAPVDDLGDWRFEGTIFKKSQEPCWDGDPTKNLYAPDVVQGSDGKYYLYYCMEHTEVISVAVCDTPAGEYRFLGHIHDESGYEPGSKDGDWIQFDPGVLVDDDGKVYVYSGFNPFFPFKPQRTYVGAYVMELKSDMVTMLGEPKVVLPCHDDSFAGHDFFEASSIRKIGDTYYFVYSSQQCHELCYATSKYPDRDFVFGGTLVSNMDLHYNGNKELLNHGGNDHGGMVCIKGQWYIFYHRHTNRTPYSRQGSAEPITIREDGFIEQVEMTSCGLNGGPLLGNGTYEAGIACNLFSEKYPRILGEEHPMAALGEASQLPYLTQDGEDREESPGTYVAGMQDGACVGFKYFDLSKSGKISVTTRGSAKGELLVRSMRGGEIIARIAVRPSDDWQKASTAWICEGGVLPLYFTFCGEGAMDLLKFSLE